MLIRLAASCAAAATILAGTAALACDGRAVECYQKVRLPDVYAERSRPVVARPAYREVVVTPPFVMHRPKRLEMYPGRWIAERNAPVYATRYEPVLLRPARTVYDVVPARRTTVRERVVVKPASVRWEHRGDRRCKIVTPAVMRVVEREVIVRARRVARMVPAVYGTERSRVLIKPGSVRHVYQPAVHAVVDRPLVIGPQRRVIAHPALIGMERERVLVRRGGYAWAPSRPGLFHR